LERASIKENTVYIFLTYIFISIKVFVTFFQAFVIIVFPILYPIQGHNFLITTMFLEGCFSYLFFQKILVIFLKFIFCLLCVNLMISINFEFENIRFFVDKIAEKANYIYRHDPRFSMVLTSTTNKF
jgi:hypothetical protein